MANTSIYNAFERMWQHILAAIGNAVSEKADKYELDSKADIIETQAALDAKAPAGYGLGAGATYLNDFNAVHPSGFYYTGSGTANRPANVNTYSCVVYVQRTSSEFTQFITSVSSNNIVVRSTTDAGVTWRTYRMVTTDMFSYSNGTLNITM